MHIYSHTHTRAHTHTHVHGPQQKSKIAIIQVPTLHTSGVVFPQHTRWGTHQLTCTVAPLLLAGQAAFICVIHAYVLTYMHVACTSPAVITSTGSVEVSLVCVLYCIHEAFSKL